MAQRYIFNPLTGNFDAVGTGTGGSINVGTGNVGDLVKVTDTAGTTFGRVATSTLVPTSFEDLLEASPTIIALQTATNTGSTPNNPNNTPSESNPLVTQNQSIINNLIFG